MEVVITHIGGPTTLIDVGGWRLLTDPTFDPPGRTYYHGRGIFRHVPELHARTKIAPSDFTVGSRMAVGSMTKEATLGKFGGLAVFNRALTDDEMRKLHEAADVGSIK